MAIPWTQSTLAAIRRQVAATGRTSFTRKELLRDQQAQIEQDTGTRGITPDMTLSRELQQIRDAGYVEFLKRGSYRWLGEIGATSKGVLVPNAQPIVQIEPESFFRFNATCRVAVSRMIGQWVVFQTGYAPSATGYHAAARISRIDPDPTGGEILRAMIEPGTFFEFGRDVPFRWDEANVEHGLIDSEGRLDAVNAAQTARLLSDDDFDRIIALGLVEEEELLPRVDDASTLGDPVDALFVEEERAPFEVPVDRERMLTTRAVRDRQFRKRVLDVYHSTCAFTGMKLINGGGRAETQAAHIKSVKAGGPDTARNGIALSGTVHWMFDRGLLSLSDDGEILLSRRINDVDGVERLIFRDRRARLPASPATRPHPRYLHWHRSECFHH